MKPITIALPGEKRNAKRIQELFTELGYMSQGDQGKDIFQMLKLGVTAVSMRAPEAIKMLLSGKISGAINGVDAFTESSLASRMKIRQETSNSKVFADTILGYDPLPPPMSRDIFSDKVVTTRSAFTYTGVFDTLPVSTLKLLVRADEGNKLTSLEKISRRGDILTAYPYLTRAILARAYTGRYVGNIQKITGKVEALLATGYGQSAVDIVDTGNTARSNDLIIGPTLFESYPAFLTSERAISEDPRVRKLARNMENISNDLYYNSSLYREKFPRG